MTLRECFLLKSSFDRLSPWAEQTVGLFCARLFELEPGLRDQMQGDLVAEGRTLLQTLSRAVRGLEDLDALPAAARHFGYDHAMLGVRQKHYDAVGEALLWTLSKGLGPDFTQEMREVWSKTYWQLAETIKAGVRDASAKLGRVA